MVALREREPLTSFAQWNRSLSVAERAAAHQEDFTSMGADDNEEKRKRGAYARKKRQL